MDRTEKNNRPKHNTVRPAKRKVTDIDDFKDAFNNYLKELKDLYKTDLPLAKELAQKALIRTGVLNEDGTPKEQIVDYPPYIDTNKKPKQKIIKSR